MARSIARSIDLFAGYRWAACVTAEIAATAYLHRVFARALASLYARPKRNPVILLDEIDKMGMVARRPAAALLEVLDPGRPRFRGPLFNVSSTSPT